MATTTTTTEDDSGAQVIDDIVRMLTAQPLPTSVVAEKTVTVSQALKELLEVTPDDKRLRYITRSWLEYVAA